MSIQYFFVALPPLLYFWVTKLQFTTVICVRQVHWCMLNPLHMSIIEHLNLLYVSLNLLQKHFYCFQPGRKIVSLLPAAAPINYLLLRLSLSFSNKSYLFLDVIRKNFLVISLLYFEFQTRERNTVFKRGNYTKFYVADAMVINWILVSWYNGRCSLNLSWVYHLVLPAEIF